MYDRSYSTCDSTCHLKFILCLPVAEQELRFTAMFHCVSSNESTTEYMYYNS